MPQNAGNSDRHTCSDFFNGYHGVNGPAITGYVTHLWVVCCIDFAGRNMYWPLLFQV